MLECVQLDGIKYWVENNVTFTILFRITLKNYTIMMLAIAIIAGVGFIASFFHNISEHDKFDANLPLAVILTLSTWSCLPLAITIMGVVVLIAIIGACINEKE